MATQPDLQHTRVDGHMGRQIRPLLALPAQYMQPRRAGSKGWLADGSAGAVLFHIQRHHSALLRCIVWHLDFFSQHMFQPGTLHQAVINHRLHMSDLHWTDGNRHAAALLFPSVPPRSRNSGHTSLCRVRPLINGVRPSGTVPAAYPCVWPWCCRFLCPAHISDLCQRQAALDHIPAQTNTGEACHTLACEFHLWQHALIVWCTMSFSREHLTTISAVLFLCLASNYVCSQRRKSLETNLRALVGNVCSALSAKCTHRKKPDEEACAPSQAVPSAHVSAGQSCCVPGETPVPAQAREVP